MPTTDLELAGAQRAAMVLDKYDPEDNERLFKLLADLADYALERTGVDLRGIVLTATTYADERRGYTLAEHHARRAAEAACTGERYLVNPDAPEEGTDIHHARPCPTHPDPTDDVVEPIDGPLDVEAAGHRNAKARREADLLAAAELERVEAEVRAIARALFAGENVDRQRRRAERITDAPTRDEVIAALELDDGGRRHAALVTYADELADTAARIKARIA